MVTRPGVVGVLGGLVVGVLLGVLGQAVAGVVGLRKVLDGSHGPVVVGMGQLGLLRFVLTW